MDMDQCPLFSNSEHRRRLSSSGENRRQPNGGVSKKIFGDIEEIEDDVERRYSRFTNFSINLYAPLDHLYFYRNHTRELRFIPELRFRPRIKQEWEFLSKHTPASTFVRAYEDRVDLMRVAIIAPPGSDFHHSLFFFDVFFPGNYPFEPPEVCCHHYGLDLGRNLKPETWFDRLKQNLHGSERKSILRKELWDPKKSNVLHLLNVIQNLVSDQPGPFVLACEMMMAVLRTPQSDFECFVQGHFRKRAHPVLLKFKENKYDSEVMINWFVKLFKAFESNGAYCKHHLDFLKSRNLCIEEVEARIRHLEGPECGREDYSFMLDY